MLQRGNRIQEDFSQTNCKNKKKPAEIHDSAGFPFLLPLSTSVFVGILLVFLPKKFSCVKNLFFCIIEVLRNMESVSSLSTTEGRVLLRRAYRVLREDRGVNIFTALLLSWRLCTRETNAVKILDEDIPIAFPLGVVSGSALWMTEIVNRQHYSAINSFVYFGAAILLLVVGFRRLYPEQAPDVAVMGSIVFEAALLVILFLTMLFSPSDEYPVEEVDQSSETSEIVREIGEIAHDYASITVRLEQVSDALEIMTKQQEEMAAATRSAVETAMMAVSPNPLMIEQLRETNQALGECTRAIELMTAAAAGLQREQVEVVVRKELEKIISDKALHSHAHRE